MVAGMAFVLVLAFPVAAMAYHEPFAPGTGCGACHGDGTADQYDYEDVYDLPTCEDCHDLSPDVAEWYGADNHYSGPHGFYTTTTGKCDNCHSVHDAAEDGVMLLAGPTTWSTCFTCHDGTGGFGVYGTIEDRTGIDPLDDDPATEGGGHAYAVTSVVPGGDPDTGGDDASRVFGGQSGYLICTDCHSVHGASVVDPFVGDRRRLRANQPSILSTKLLKRQPTSATTTTTRYGSDWCLSCHAGRASSNPLHNHPVESTGSSFTAGTPYDYGNLPVLSTDTTTGTTVLSGLGGIVKTGLPSFMHQPNPPYASENRGYLMPYPRTELQTGHAPICQQCHEDSRSVGTLVGDGSTADAADGVITVDSADGVTASDNPRFQNFPHETENNLMLVETADDLCLNCHPVSQLP